MNRRSYTRYKSTVRQRTLRQYTRKISWGPLLVGQGGGHCPPKF